MSKYHIGPLRWENGHIKREWNLDLFVEVSLVSLASVSLNPLFFLLWIVTAGFAHTLDNTMVLI